MLTTRTLTTVTAARLVSEATGIAAHAVFAEFSDGNGFEIDGVTYMPTAPMVVIESRMHALKPNVLAFFTGAALAEEDMERDASLKATKNYVALFISGRLA